MSALQQPGGNSTEQCTNRLCHSALIGLRDAARMEIRNYRPTYGRTGVAPGARDTCVS